MKKLSGHISKEKAHSLIDNHKGMREEKIIGFGNENNNHIDVHKCILWGDWIEETDAYGEKSPNRYVVDEFIWEERTPEWLLEMKYKRK